MNEDSLGHYIATILETFDFWKVSFFSKWWVLPQQPISLE